MKVNAKPIAVRTPYIAPNSTDPSGLANALLPSMTTIVTPHIEAKIASQPSQPCFSRSIRNESAAAKTGIVATAVRTTEAEVSTIPSVKVTEFILKAIMTKIPCQLKRLRHSLEGFFANNVRQIISDAMPINKPRQPINGQRSSSEILMTRVSGVRTRTPIRATKIPNFSGDFWNN